MILARQVFQVKFGRMDEILAAFKAMPESTRRSMNVHRVLTDISGNFFTLVLETKAESVDAFMKALQASFEAPEFTGQPNPFMELMESGHREFYTIEYDSET